MRPVQKGFTLVELLVVISIISILAVMGMVIFTNTQKNARDARRRADIDAIDKAIEVKRTASSGYGPVTEADFAGGSIPADPTPDRVYCMWTNSDPNLPPPPISGIASTWTGSTSSCPGVQGAEAQAIFVSGMPASTVFSWTVCARLENQSGVYCRSSVQ